MKKRDLGSAPLSTAEAARHLGVSPSTLKRWTDAGYVAFELTPGGHRRFSPQALAALARSGTPKDDGFAETVDGMLAGSTVELEARVAIARRREGSWARAFDRHGPVGAELDRRLAQGELTSVQCRWMREKFCRALARFLSADLELYPAEATVVTAPGWSSGLMLQAAELVLQEVGWRTRWAGDAGPGELRAELERHATGALILALDPRGDPRAEREGKATVFAAVARERAIPFAVLFLAPQPRSPIHGVQRSWQELSTWLASLPSRVVQTELPGAELRRLVDRVEPDDA